MVRRKQVKTWRSSRESRGGEKKGGKNKQKLTFKTIFNVNQQRGDSLIAREGHTQSKPSLTPGRGEYLEDLLHTDSPICVIGTSPIFSENKHSLRTADTRQTHRHLWEFRLEQHTPQTLLWKSSKGPLPQYQNPTSYILQIFNSAFHMTVDEMG